MPELVGKTYNELTVLSFFGMKQRKVGTVATWLVQCSCGSEPFTITKGNLGRTKSCGCLKHISKTKLNLVGQTFERLLVIKEINKSTWECLCNCGNITKASTRQLRAGKIKSCGCFRKETGAKNITTFLKSYRSICGFNPDLPMENAIKQLRSVMKPILEETKIRDNYTCVLCKKRGIILHSHHIIPVSQDITLALEPTNIITLCKKCHINKAHSKNVKTISIKYQQILLNYIKVNC